MKFSTVHLLLALVCNGSLAVVGEAASCPANEAQLPIVYRFADNGLNQKWVYASLAPLIAYSGRPSRPLESQITESGLRVTFCVPEPDDGSSFQVTFGRRKYTVVRRPIVTAADGTKAMTPALLLDQPRPDWIIVKSLTRTDAANRRAIALLDVELYNFGREHNGARVSLSIARSTGGVCWSNPPPVQVTILASAGMMHVLASDPQFPELVERTTTMTRSCGGGFSISADLGVTGPLPEGPIRLRYAVDLARIGRGGGAYAESSPTSDRRALVFIPGGEVRLDLQLSGDAVLWADCARTGC
jgi:hypothetical protein